MWGSLATLVLSAALIALTSWMSRTQPRLAGFLLALPLSSAIALAASYARFQSAEQSVAFARSIFLSIPLSLVFFVPFLLARVLGWGFWGLYGSGLALLGLAYGLHHFLYRILS